MTRLGIIQTKTYSSNRQGIKHVSLLLENAGRKDADIVCLPEQWLHENKISDFATEFKDFAVIAKNYSMTVIPGAFYENKKSSFISAPVIGPKGEIIGKQEKIHPFDYEHDLVKSGRHAKIFKTSCKFGVVICYDMVFAQVANTLAKKGAEVILSPSRIVKRGIEPWHLYVQARALENRIPILAANVQNYRFGGKSIIVDMTENRGVVIPKIVTKLNGQSFAVRQFELSKYKKSRKSRLSDSVKFS